MHNEVWGCAETLPYAFVEMSWQTHYKQVDIRNISSKFFER